MVRAIFLERHMLNKHSAKSPSIMIHLTRGKVELLENNEKERVEWNHPYCHLYIASSLGFPSSLVGRRAMYTWFQKV